MIKYLRSLHLIKASTVKFRILKFFLACLHLLHQFHFPFKVNFRISRGPWLVFNSFGLEVDSSFLFTMTRSFGIDGGKEGKGVGGWGRAL